MIFLNGDLDFDSENLSVFQNYTNSHFSITPYVWRRSSKVVQSIWGISNLRVFQDNFMISRLVKMFRAARLIKLLNYGGEMRTLLFVFLKALKSLPHVMFLVMLTFYIYAIIGMQIFGKVEADPDNNPDYVITRYNNFESFQNAMILLFR